MLKFSFSEEGKRFDIINSLRKKWYEFYVALDEKDAFMYWIDILSKPEFMVDVDLKDTQIKEYAPTIYGPGRFRFRVKASGKEEHINRWYENLKGVVNFLNGDYGLEYITRSDKDKKEKEI